MPWVVYVITSFIMHLFVQILCWVCRLNQIEWLWLREMLSVWDVLWIASVLESDWTGLEKIMTACQPWQRLDHKHAHLYTYSHTYSHTHIIMCGCINSHLQCHTDNFLCWFRHLRMIPVHFWTSVLLKLVILAGTFALQSWMETPHPPSSTSLLTPVSIADWHYQGYTLHAVTPRHHIVGVVEPSLYHACVCLCM